MAQLNRSNDMEAPYNGANGHAGTADNSAIESAFVDSRTGKQVDVEKVMHGAACSLYVPATRHSAILGHSCRTGCCCPSTRTVKAAKLCQCGVCHVLALSCNNLRCVADLLIPSTAMSAGFSRCAG